jgi:hypothetical protein
VVIASAASNGYSSDRLERPDESGTILAATCLTETMRDLFASLLIGSALVASPLPARGQDPAQAATAVPEVVSGSIEWRTVLGVDAAATFSVRTRAGRGEITVRNHDGVSFRGTIRCYYRRSDSSVSFSGTIDSFEGSNHPGNRQGTAAFRMSIQDGGARDQGTDLVSLVRSATPLHCAAPHIADRPITKGDLAINPGGR